MALHPLGEIAVRPLYAREHCGFLLHNLRPEQPGFQAPR
jgi:hypothetical protein